MSCPLCVSANLTSIERDIQGSNLQESSLEAIARVHNLKLFDIQTHAMFHMHIVPGDVLLNSSSSSANSANSDDTTFEVSRNLADQVPTCQQPPNPKPGTVSMKQLAEYAIMRDSITRQARLRELDDLKAVNDEYLNTLRNLSRNINGLLDVQKSLGISVEDQYESQVRVAKLLTKPMVDAYLGVGAQIRDNTATMSKVFKEMNGDESEGANAGLIALANALRGTSSPQVD